MPSAYLQWRFHSGERVVARGPLVIILVYFLLYTAVLKVHLNMSYQNITGTQKKNQSTDSTIGLIVSECRLGKWS